MLIKGVSNRAIIVTGAGRAFCAGADLGTATETFDYRSRDGQMLAEKHRDGGGQLTLRIFESIKPIIAAIYGPAVGIGITMTLAMDIRIADNTSAVSVALARQMFWRMLGADHPMEAHKVDSRGIYYTGRSSDAREGITSFLEKRSAKFADRPSTDMPAFYPWWEERTF